MIGQLPTKRMRRFPVATASAVLIALVVMTGIAGLSAFGRQPPPVPNFGDPLPGLTPEQFQQFLDGKAAFVDTHSDVGGLGPVFNGNSCRQCHSAPATGGGSTFLGIRIGANINGIFDPLLNSGGPSIQRFGAGGLFGFEFFGEVIPADATIVAFRRANPLFGLGLVEAVSDATFEKLATMQSKASPDTAGRTNRVRNLKSGQTAVGKFGWKSARATLLDFAADAYKDELGITVPGFVADEDGRQISEENPPQGHDNLLKFNLVNSPNLDNDANVRGFRDFIAFLAPPPPLPLSDQALRGQTIFLAIGCADCHLPTLQTGPNNVAALDRVTFHPYSDFLLHDMGSLGDGIEQGRATGREMRTATLWGLHEATTLLHDGRATTVRDAIRLHDGQSRDARQSYLSLSRGDAAALLAFLLSI
jgi:CxxC motif-containing protein (DUF1111 family)